MISLTIFCFLLKVAGMFRDNSIGKIKVTYVVSRLMIITNKEVLAQAVTYFLSVSLSASHSTKITVWNFGNSTYQWNGTLRFHRPDPSHRGFGYCSCKHAGYKRALLGTTILSIGKRHFGPTDRNKQTVKVDHLQSWSQIFRSDQTEVVSSIWFLTKISGILGSMESVQCKHVLF